MADVATTRNHQTNEREGHRPDSVEVFLDQWRNVRPDLDVSAMAVLGRLSRATWLIGRDLHNFLAPYALEPWEFDVLATLRRSGDGAPLTAGRLTASTMVGSAAMTNRVDRLVRRGLVTRETNPANRRQLLIALTPEGFDLIDRVVSDHVRHQHEVLQPLDDADQHVLSELLRALLVGLGDAPEDALET